jgi:hypothetical protein
VREEQAVHTRDIDAGRVRLDRGARVQRRTPDEHPLLALQRTAGNTAVAQLVNDERESPVLDVVGKGGGQPLPTDLRSDMEQRLGAVRDNIHKIEPALAM